MSNKLRVGVICAGRWSASAHLPGFTRSPHSEIVALCDLDEELCEKRAAEFGIPDVMTDAEKLLARTDIDVVDIVTRGDHQDLVFKALDAGKHILVEKPVCHDYRDVIRAHELAEAKSLKTKVGLTFRYAPAVMYMFDLIREGFIGTPYVFNGYEQNSQWLNPDNPMDKRIHKTKPVGEAPWGVDLSREGIAVSPLEGYGAPTIDIALECVGDDLKQVVGILSNMAPMWPSALTVAGRLVCDFEGLPRDIAKALLITILANQNPIARSGYPGPARAGRYVSATPLLKPMDRTRTLAHSIGPLDHLFKLHFFPPKKAKAPGPDHRGSSSRSASHREWRPRSVAAYYAR